ncbi:MAG: hypothetical protein ACK5NN_05175 [Sphingomonadaceae bacterium]
MLVLRSAYGDHPAYALERAIDDAIEDLYFQAYEATGNEGHLPDAEDIGYRQSQDREADSYFSRSESAEGLAGESERAGQSGGEQAAASGAQLDALIADGAVDAPLITDRTGAAFDTPDGEGVKAATESAWHDVRQMQQSGADATSQRLDHAREIAASMGLKDLQIGRVGNLGPEIEGLGQRWPDAVRLLSAIQDGDARSVLSHPDAPEIDVVWGDKEGGLAHILAKHGGDIGDDFQDELFRMKVVSRDRGRLILESEDKTAVVALDWNGEPKRWLLAAYSRPGAGRLAAAPLADRAAQSPGRSVPEDIADARLPDKTPDPNLGELSAMTGAQAARYAAMLFVATTLTGGLAMQLKAVAAGKDPRPMDDPAFWGAAILQGGGFGIFGDFLGASQSRFGGGFAQTLAGPMVDDAQGIVNVLKSGDPRRKLVQEAKGFIPGNNLWYTRAAFDRLVADTAQQWIDPDYRKSWQRMERYAQDQGTDYFWEPGEAMPGRAPDWENALASGPDE